MGVNWRNQAITLIGGVLSVTEMLCQRFVADYASEPHDSMLSKRCGLLGGHSSNAQSSFQFEYVAAN